MSGCAIAVRLKISDNEANTALSALRRLGVPVERLERAIILLYPEARNDAAAHVARDETIFNPNKHVLEQLDDDIPRTGETWVQDLGADDEVRSFRRYVGWRLFDADGLPVQRDVVVSAAERLLCNPAIERSMVR